VKTIRTLIWKELLDLSRDKGTLFSTLLLPLIAFPIMGIVIGYVFQVQPITLAIIDQDNSEWSKWLIEYFKAVIGVHGVPAKHMCVGAFLGRPVIIYLNYTDVRSAEVDPKIDLIVIIPKNFSKLVPEVNVKIPVYYEVKTTSRADIAVSILWSAVSNFERHITEARLKILAPSAKIKDIENLRNPVEIKFYRLLRPSGAVAKPEEKNIYLTMMVLIIALFMTISPPIAFISDSVAGERERKTLECLLVTPTSRSQILVSKLFSSIILSFLSSGASTIGAYIMYMLMLSGLSGGSITLPISIEIIGVFSLTVFLTVFVTVSMALLISCLSDSIRSAQSKSITISMIGSLVMFIGLYGDIDRLPQLIRILLYFIPYTHSLQILNQYMKFDIYHAVPHILCLIAFIMVFLGISVKVFNSERIFFGSKVEGKMTKSRKRIVKFTK